MAISDYRAMFGRRLRFLRKRKGMTQEALAKDAGLDRTYVAGTERGERNISLISIMRLADALEVFPGELFKFSQTEDEGD